MGFSPSPENANSVMFVLPTMIAPAERSRATASASRAAGAAPRSTTEPARVGSPATSKRSFTETGMPQSGSGAAPRRRTASA